jgi:signal transduction histidine kinase
MSRASRRSTVAAVAGDPVQTRDQADDFRRFLPLAALAFAVVAALADPSSALNVALTAIPVIAFAAWAYRPSLPLVALAVVVIAPVVVAQRSGALEPSLFLASLLAFVVGRWARSRAEAVALGVLACATPLLVALVQDPSQVSAGIWVLGIAFPWLLAFGSARQAELARQLDATRRELAQQALLQERRRIARDVHDFVGHGLAAMMLQVTSARHVLRRDPDAAEEALRSAEDVGRRSMRELRRTVALLRADDETGADAPVPTAADIPALVDEARAGGLAVELRTRGDLSRVGAGVGVAMYRIAQEALANAARHAPRARTVLGVELADGHVALTAETSGPLQPAQADPERPRYGLIGMRERAAALGGELDAGRTRYGWRVCCRLPLAEEP